MIGMSTEGLYVPTREGQAEGDHPNIGYVVDEDTGRVYTPNELRDEAAYLMHLADEADYQNGIDDEWDGTLLIDPTNEA